MKKVYTAENPAEAHLVAGLLDEAGIECVVEGEMLTGARMELPMDASTLPGVHVRDEDAARALALIAERRPASAAVDGDGDDDLAAEHPGLVWFKRWLLADILAAIALSFAFVLSQVVSWVSGYETTPAPRAMVTVSGGAFGIACAIACLIVPERRAPR